MFAKVILASLAAVALSSGAATVARADPLITPVGPGGGIVNVSNTQYLVVSFTFGGSFTNVSVAASVTSAFAGQTGIAFLMNQVGPGTTAANQLGSTAVNFAVTPSTGTVSFVSLFSGLNLGPGSYHLVLVGLPGGDTSLTGLTTGLPGGVTYTTAPGTAVGVFQFTGGSFLNSGYPPASTFLNVTDPHIGNPFFTVNGTPVPEPTTMLLLGTGLLGLASGVRKRKLQR